MHAKADLFECWHRQRWVERALPLWHDALGLIGKADVVEFLALACALPVEYKHTAAATRLPTLPPATTCNWPRKPCAWRP